MLSVIDVFTDTPRGGTQPVFGILEDGTEVLIKCIRENVVLPALLVNEYAGLSLAHVLGCNVPSFQLATIPSDLAGKWPKGAVSPGLCIAINRIPYLHSWRERDGNMLRRITDRRALVRLIIVDTILLNGDRFLNEGTGRSHSQNVFFCPVEGSAVEVVALDFTDAFEGDFHKAILLPPELAKVYGNFPEFGPFISEAMVQEECQKLFEFSAVGFNTLLSPIPGNWGLTPMARMQMANWLARRCVTVGSELSTWLRPYYWPQRHLSDLLPNRNEA